VVLQNMVCDHNYTTLANEQGPGPCSSVSPLHFGSGWLAVWLRATWLHAGWLPAAAIVVRAPACLPCAATAAA
jgi:hypothetical protein